MAVGALAVLVLVLSLVGTRHGPSISPDSRQYLAGAEHLADGRGYLDGAGRPQTTYPPGLSITLATGDKLGVDPDTGARLLDAAAYAALVVLTFVLARRHLARTWLAVAAAAAVAVTDALFGVYIFVWSEPVFCVLVVGLLLVLETVMRRRSASPGLIVVAAALGSLGFAYRYAGISLVVLALAAITVGAWVDGVAATARRALGYLGCAAIIPSLMVARNLSEGSGALGPRPPSMQHLRPVLDDVVTTTGRWLSNAEDRTPGDALLVLVAIIVAAGMVVAFRRWGWRLRDPHAVPLFPLGTFVVGYLAYRVASELVTVIDRVDNRLLAPLIAPALVLALFFGEQLIDTRAVTSRRWMTLAIVAVGSGWLVLSLANTVDHAF
jgi:hypothetical protein